MIQTEIKNGFTHIIATEGKLQKKGSSNTIGKRTYLLPNETVDMYEEVTQELPYTKEEYDAKVEALIAEKYTPGEEAAIKRKMINILLNPEAVAYADGEDYIQKIRDEYNAYNSYAEACKAKAPEALVEDKKRIAEEGVLLLLESSESDNETSNVESLNT